MKIIHILTMIFFLSSISSCNKKEEASGITTNIKTRSFYMGFTPWLYAASSQAESDVYNFINTNGDIIAHHFQQGIPFNDAGTLGNFSNYETNIQNEVNNRVNLTNNSKVIYLAIDSLNGSRNGLTDFWGTSANQSRPAPWNARSFNNSDVISAYTNFSLELIARFNPTYFNFAPEISDLMISNPSEFNNFKIFANVVYSSIKAAYPNLKLMVSIALKTPGSAEMVTALNGFDEIKDYVDIVGVSTYAYAFYAHANKGDPANLPSDWLTQITDIAPGKTYAIVETGWIAENLSIPSFSLNVDSDADKQDLYLQALLQGANEINAETVLWFTSYDYDTLWSTTLGMDNLAKIWKDTGLYDENLAPRESLSTWKSWYNYKRSP